MRAVCWEGKKKVKVETVPDPKILNQLVKESLEKNRS